LVVPARGRLEFFMQQPTDDGDAQQGELPTVRTAARELAVLLASVVLLAFDELNPVKVLCSYTRWFMGISEVHLGVLASLLLLALGINQRDHILYNCARTFFRCTFNNIFFSSVEIVGMENLPKEGPLIITGNHNNQFVDGLMLLTNCPREISFMIARKSWDRPLVGFLARAFHCIPVARPQDLAYAGKGTVTLQEGSAKVQGEGTSFNMEVSPGSQLQLHGQEQLLKVKEVHSATELTLDAPFADSKSGLRYKVLPKVDQSAMYSEVHQSLCSGKCLGIFPEGGSHDRTDLLPLKAGVAVIALEALRLHHLNVPIVPVGLNYFRGHMFGGRVVMEFGAPLMISEETHATYETNRREATEEVLQQVATAMRSVIVPTEDYKTLQQIFMVRRLWVKEGLKLSPSKAMDLNRRFAVGVNRILRLAERASGQSTDLASNELSTHDSPAENQEPLSKQELQVFQELRMELEGYMQTLKRLGIRDHQVPQLVWWTAGDLFGRFLYLLVAMAMGIIPQLMFNVPIMLVANRYATVEQQKSLKSSSVKLAARDVVMSYKVIYVLICVPVLYVLYGTLIWIFTDWCLTSRTLILLSLPLFAFWGMKASEQGVRAYKDIMPHFRRLVLPEDKKEQDLLPGRRAQLQRQVHKLVGTFGPRLGDLYYEKDVDWTKHMSNYDKKGAKDDGSPSRKNKDQSQLKARLPREETGSDERGPGSME